MRDGKPLMQINELEYVKGEIWANVWHSEEPRIFGKPNYIARIDPTAASFSAGSTCMDFADDVEYDAYGNRL